MKTCEEFQLAIEMKRYGALEAQSAAEADRHVATCQTCQRELAALADVDAALKGAPPPSLKFSEVSKALQRDRFWTRNLPWIAIGSFAGQGAILSVVLAPESPLKLWALLVAAGVVVAVFGTWDLRRKARGAAEAARLGLDAWMRHRRQRLDSDLRDLKRMMGILPVIGLGMALGAVVVEPLAGRVLLGLLAATVALMMGYFWLGYRPKLVREKAELGEAS